MNQLQSLKKRIYFSKIQWEKADWSLQDIVISEQLNCSRSRVQQKRRELGKEAPKDAKKPRHRPQDEISQFIIKNKGSFRGKTISEIKNLYPIFKKVSYSLLYQRLLSRKIAFKRENLRRDISHINFYLPNIILARIWGQPKSKFANWRSRRALGPARWELRGGRDKLNPLMLKATEAEEKRAKKFLGRK